MSGPYLYDDGPTSPHTGQARSRRGLLSVVLVSTLAVAILAVVLLPIVNGSGTDRAKQVTSVFLKAMAKGDTDTAHQLLCDTERARLTEAQVAKAYLGPAPGTVGSASEVKQNGDTVERVDVRWADGSTSRYTLVNQSGPRICSTQPVG
jgi:hypothetical protein